MKGELECKIKKTVALLSFWRLGPSLGSFSQSLLRAGFVHFLFILDRILALMTFAPGITPMNMLCYMGKVTLPL